MSTAVLNRLVISLAGNITRSFLSLIAGLLVARGLGPEQYGILAFLLASFNALRGLMEMGTSNAFFTFLSQRVRGKAFYLYYFLWMALQFLLPLLFLLLLIPDAWLQQLWLGEARERVALAFVAVFLQSHAWQMVVQIGESQRFTKHIQWLNVSVAASHCTLMFLLFNLEQGLVGPSIDAVLCFVAAEFVVVMAVAYVYLPLQFHTEPEPWRDVLKEYWVYCAPLLLFAWLQVATGFADNWLLQHFAGSVQQAYYAVAMQLVGVSMVATRSVLKILWKEVAEAHAQGNMQRVEMIYRRAQATLLAIGAIVSAALLPWSQDILRLTLGEAYLEGAVVLSIMLLYPIHQTLGQLNGSMFFALTLTRPYVWVNVLFNLLGLATVYFLLAPKDAWLPGLELGSVGMAIKMVLLQFLYVNLLTAYLNWRYQWRSQFFWQLFSVSLFIILAMSLNSLVNSVLAPQYFWPKVLLFVCSYLVSTSISLYFCPRILGITPRLRNFLMGSLRRKLKLFVAFGR